MPPIIAPTSPMTATPNPTKSDGPASNLGGAGLGTRLWKHFGSTPWWRLVLGGLIVLAAVAALTLPIASIRLQQRLTSDAARQEFKFAVQQEILQLTRSGLVSIKLIASDPATARDVDSALGDVERELRANKSEITLSGLAELNALIARERDAVRRDSAALSSYVAGLDLAPGTPASDEQLAALNERVAALQRSVEQLEEFQERAREIAASRPTDKAATAPTKITVSVFSVAGKPLLSVDGARVNEPASLDRQLRDEIRTTISADAHKVIVGNIMLIGLTLLFASLLIARGFAGRAVRGEQRAVVAESRERSASYARQLAEARLMVMRAQVEPHFLFNTLAHVQALQEIDPPQASVMLERLIAYLRAAMPTMRESTSTLGREIDVVRAYLELLRIRMGERLRYAIDLPDELAAVAFPPTMIATLVENAIKHGLEPKRDGGSVAIRVHSVDDRVEVLVADDGLGLGGSATAGTGVGLTNTRERLAMLYGGLAELVVEPNAPSGVRALLRVPKTPPAMVADAASDDADGVSPYTVQTTGLLALLLGWLGAHRFYVGHRRTGAVQAALGVLSLLSGGVPVFLLPLLLWVILDLVWIGTRDFNDREGRRIVRWSAADARPYREALRRRDPESSRYSRAIVLALAVPLGVFGAHRFYVGRIGSGFAMLFTLGGLGIWWIIDIVRVANGNFIDTDDKRVSEWE